MWPHDFGHSGLSAGDLHHYHSGSAAIVHLLRRRRGQGPRSTPRSVRTVLIARENGTYLSRERYLLLVRTDEVASRRRALAAPGAPSPAGASTWTRGPALHGLRRLDDVGPSLGHARTSLDLSRPSLTPIRPPPGVRADQLQASQPWARTREPRHRTVRAVHSRHHGHGRDGRPSPRTSEARQLSVGTDATPPGRTKTGRPSAGLRRAARSGRGDQRGRRRRPGPGRSRSASAGHGQGTGPVLASNKYRSHDEQVPFSRPTSTVLAANKYRSRGAGCRGGRGDRTSAAGPQRQDVRRCRGRS